MKELFCLFVPILGALFAFLITWFLAGLIEEDEKERVIYAVLISGGLLLLLYLI